MATPADVIRIAPEFATLDPDTVIQLFINDAADEIDTGVWGTKADRVIALLAAHAIACSYPDLYRKTVLSQAVGQVNRTYANQTTPRADVYATTRFGLEYLRLRRQLCLTPRVI
jgi:hypothetical protein